jgi:hypothetical protein
MSQPLVFTESEHRLAIAILQQIGLEKGRIDTMALHRTLNLPSKNAAAIQLCKFRAKIARVAVGAPAPPPIPPIPLKVKAEGKAKGSAKKRKSDGGDEIEDKARVRKVKREDVEGFKIGYHAGFATFQEDVAEVLLEGMGDVETSDVEG